MKRKTKVRIARFTRQVPILREMQALRNESVLRLVVQAAFVGGCTGGVIGVFRWLYDHGNAWIVSTLRHGANDLTTALIVFGTLTLLALIVGQMVRKEPLISGSGIPQTELALAGQLPYPGFRIVASKFVGTLLSLSGGLSVGREGPSIQMGAAVGCGFGRIFQKLTGEDPGHAPRFLIAGSVAGLAAAFGAPFAGMLFAFEEVKTIVTVPLLLFTGVASFSAWFVITILFGFGLVFPFSSIPSLDWGQMWLPVLFHQHEHGRHSVLRCARFGKYPIRHCHQYARHCNYPKPHAAEYPIRRKIQQREYIRRQHERLQFLFGKRAAHFIRRHHRARREQRAQHPSAEIQRRRQHGNKYSGDSNAFYKLHFPSNPPYRRFLCANSPSAAI